MLPRQQAERGVRLRRIETVFGVPMSLGTVANLEQEMSSALTEPYQQAEQAVRAAPAKNADETSWNLAGNLCWLWMAATQTLAGPAPEQ